MDDGGGGNPSVKKAAPFLRLFTGSKSEGLETVKWQEVFPPLPGLLVSFFFRGGEKLCCMC